MTTLMDVYDAFLSRVNEDDWSNCYSQEDLSWFIKDWRAILNTAITYFKFPRCRLDIDEDNQVFIDENMGRAEINVIATYMKQEWLKRTVDSWENIKTQYDEKDFSQANLLKTFIELKNQVIEEAKDLERIYYRSVERKPYDYKRLTGGRKKRTAGRLK